MPVFEHCTAEYKCDEHFGEHWRVQRPVAWVIDLAKATLRFRVLTACSIEDWDKACDDAWLLKSLINAQWRDCVREQGLLRMKQAERVKSEQDTGLYADLFGDE